jgi:hypothetical protein
VDKVLHSPDLLPADLAATIGPSIAKLWDTLKPERRTSATARPLRDHG